MSELTPADFGLVQKIVGNPMMSAPDRKNATQALHHMGVCIKRLEDAGDHEGAVSFANDIIQGSFKGKIASAAALVPVLGSGDLREIVKLAKEATQETGQEETAPNAAEEGPAPVEAQKEAAKKADSLCKRWCNIFGKEYTKE